MIVENMGLRCVYSQHGHGSGVAAETLKQKIKTTSSTTLWHSVSPPPGGSLAHDVRTTTHFSLGGGGTEGLDPKILARARRRSGGLLPLRDHRA